MSAHEIDSFPRWWEPLCKPAPQPVKALEAHALLVDGTIRARYNTLAEAMDALAALDPTTFTLAEVMESVCWPPQPRTSRVQRVGGVRG